MSQALNFKLDKMRTLIFVPVFIIIFLGQATYSDGDVIDPALTDFLDMMINSERSGPDLINSLYDIEQKSSNADKIYVELINYYLGAGGTECLDELITKRGKRVLFLLTEMKKQAIKCLPKYEARCIKSTQDRNAHIDGLIEAIENGIVLCPDYEDCPKIQK